MAHRVGWTAWIALPLVAVVILGCGGPGPVGSPASPSVAWSSPTAQALRTPVPSPTPSPTAAPVTFPIAVVTRYDDPRPGISTAQLVALATQGKLVVPCEIAALDLAGTPLVVATATLCEPVEGIVAKLQVAAGKIALLPPGLVTPWVKVLPIDAADLFGGPAHRSLAYPLRAGLPNPAPVRYAWASYDAAAVRTLVSTGDTCPDRGLSHDALVLGKGWDWVFDGGSARYAGFHHGKFNWSVPDAVRNDDAGALAALVLDHDVALNDFECPMIHDYSQHDFGVHFTIDPRFAGFLARRLGIDAVTLGSNHMYDLGGRGIAETVAALDAAGISHTGAGANKADALAPATVDAGGVTFAVVGWDEAGTASETSPGVARLTYENACASIRAARKVADVVVAMPQWGWPEYHADIAPRQVNQRAWFLSCGADVVLGSGTHVASWATFDIGPRGPRVVLGSHGNFLFDQNWARFTMEGVVPELTFYGTRLVQFRLHPYTIVDEGQPNLIDPLTDGSKVLAQVWHPTPFVCCRP